MVYEERFELLKPFGKLKLQQVLLIKTKALRR